MEVTKMFEFEAAHHLPGYNGACQRFHGHSYKLEVTISDVVNDRTGMVIDFSELKDVVKESVIDVLDHQNINEILDNPTAENMVTWIYSQLYPTFVYGLSKIKLWETSTSYCTWRKE